MMTTQTAAQYRERAVHAILMAEELPEQKQYFLAFARSLDQLAEHAEDHIARKGEPNEIPH